METFGLLGFIFGISALGMVVTLKSEVEKLQKDLVDAGVLADQPQREGK